MTERRPEQRNVYVGSLEEKQSSCWEVPLSLQPFVYMGLFADVKIENRVKREFLMLKPKRGLDEKNHTWRFYTGKATTRSCCSDNLRWLQRSACWSELSLFVIYWKTDASCPFAESWLLKTDFEGRIIGRRMISAHGFHESREVEEGFWVLGFPFCLKLSHTKSPQTTTTSNHPMIPIRKGH